MDVVLRAERALVGGRIHSAAVGVVDGVHVNAPGTDWEGFTRATAAAAAGALGVTS
jgi:hypothetical protein